MRNGATVPSERLEAARELLARHGLAGCAASAEGADGEVLVLTASAADEERLQSAGEGLLREIRRTGFRYIALDLAPRGDAR